MIIKKKALRLIHKPELKQVSPFTKQAVQLIEQMINTASKDHDRVNESISLVQQSYLLIKCHLDDQEENKKRPSAHLRAKYKRQTVWQRRSLRSTPDDVLSFAPKGYCRLPNCPRITATNISLHGAKKAISNRVLNYYASRTQHLIIDIDLVSAHVNILAGFLGERSKLASYLRNNVDFWQSLIDIASRNSNVFSKLDQASKKNLIKTAIYTTINGGNALNEYNMTSNITDSCDSILDTIISSGDPNISDEQAIQSSYIYNPIRSSLRSVIFELEIEVDKILDAISRPFGNDSFALSGIDRVEPYTFEEKKKAASRLLQGYEVVTLAVMTDFIKNNYNEFYIINLAHDGLLIATPCTPDIDVLVKDLMTSLNGHLLDFSIFFFKDEYPFLRADIKSTIDPRMPYSDPELAHYDALQLQADIFLKNSIEVDPDLPQHRLNFYEIQSAKMIINSNLVHHGGQNQWYLYSVDKQKWEKVGRSTARQHHLLYINSIYTSIEQKYPSLLETVRPKSEVSKLDVKYYFVSDGKELFFRSPNSTTSFFFQNGKLRLSHQGPAFNEFTPRSSDDYNTWSIPYDYIDLPPNHLYDSQWMQFIQDVTGGDKDFMLFLQKIIGYTITSKQWMGDYQIGLEIVGPPSSGKSVFCDYLFDIVWKEISYKPLSNFLTSSGNVANMEFANLSRQRVVFFTEPIIKGDADAALIKQLIGNKSLTGRLLYENSQTVAMSATLVFCTNARIIDTYEHIPGLSRRIVSIPFVETVDNDRRDPYLIDRLSNPDTISSVIKWCLDGAHMFMSDPECLTRSYRFMDKLNGMNHEADIVAEFAKSYLVQRSQDSFVRFPRPLVILIFNHYYEGQGSYSSQAFYKKLGQLLDVCVTKKKGMDGCIYFTNLWIPRVYLWDFLAYCMSKYISIGKDDKIIKSKDITRTIERFFIISISIFDEIKRYRREHKKTIKELSDWQILEKLDRSGPYKSPTQPAKISSDKILSALTKNFLAG